MIVFADNDILIKLAGCDLLIPFCEAIGTQNTDFFVTSSAKFAIPKQSKKKLKHQKLFNSYTNLWGVQVRFKMYSLKWIFWIR